MNDIEQAEVVDGWYRETRDRLEREKETGLLILTAQAGAGHYRQAHDLLLMMRQAGWEDRTIIREVGLGSLTVWDSVYKWLQARPGIYSTLGPAINRITSSKIADWVQERGRVATLNWQLDGVNYDANKLIVASTHVTGAVVGRQMAATGQAMGLLEYVPDPWPVLTTMTVAKGLGAEKHAAVFHDSMTVKRFKKQRPNGERHCLGWGTLSDPRKRLIKPEIQITDQSKPVVVNIELSGNRIVEFEIQMGKFVEINQREIREGKIDLVIHCMHHPEARDYFDQLLQKLDLTGAVKVICKETMVRAVTSRADLAGGFGEFEGREVDIVFSKGGEVPLEVRIRKDRKHTTTAVTFGGGHEKVDTDTGVLENRAINLIGTDPGEWLPRARSLANNQKPDTPSIATLAPLYFIDQQMAYRLEREYHDLLVRGQ